MPKKPNEKIPNKQNVNTDLCGSGTGRGRKLYIFILQASVLFGFMCYFDSLKQQW